MVKRLSGVFIGASCLASVVLGTLPSAYGNGHHLVPRAEVFASSLTDLTGKVPVQLAGGYQGGFGISTLGGSGPAVGRGAGVTFPPNYGGGFLPPMNAYSPGYQPRPNLPRSFDSYSLKRSSGIGMGPDSAGRSRPADYRGEGGYPVFTGRRNRVQFAAPRMPALPRQLRYNDKYPTDKQ